MGWHLTMALVATAPSAWAADSATEPGQPGQNPVRVERLLTLAPMQLALSEMGQSFAGQELGSERLVKGAPYCADAVHETIQLLPQANGQIDNRIVRKQTTRLCRDGEGRTRQEVEGDGARRIYLRDPVSNESWVLDPVAKTARRLSSGVSMSMSAPQGLHDPSAWREHAEQLREWARGLADRARSGLGGTPMTPPPMPALPPMPPMPPAAGNSVAPKTAVAANAPTAVVIAPEAGGGARHDIQLRILRTDADGVAPPLPPGMSWRGASLAPRGQGVTTALPARDIEGLRVHGERTTWTIEAGKMGNEKPIAVTREVWRSPDLLLTVQSNDFDPRNGETAYRLTNLKRGEPDAALMKVPADYDVRSRPSAPRAPSAPRSKV